MAIGSIQTVLVCSPTNSAPSVVMQQLCPKIGNQWYRPQSTQAYLLNPSAQQQLDAALGPFDYGYAGGLWSLAFTSVVGLHFASQGIGRVLDVIRRG